MDREYVGLVTAFVSSLVIIFCLIVWAIHGDERDTAQWRQRCGPHAAPVVTVTPMFSNQDIRCVPIVAEQP